MTIDEAIKILQGCYATMDTYGFLDDMIKRNEAIRMAINALCAQQETEKDKPLTQRQLRAMNDKMVYCLELNTNVRVITSKEGLVDIYYEIPGSCGTFHAMNVTLYRIDE